MQETEILSTLPSVSPKPAERPSREERLQVFDACHIGVVLRAVLFVEVVLGVGVMFQSASPMDWLTRLALVTGGALPSTLGWLLCICALKSQLQQLPTFAQYLLGTLLGFVAGLSTCKLLIWVLADNSDWPLVASGFAGALMALALVAALHLRARGSTPAATTARLTELQARIRPHFLFNTLNSAVALVREEPAKAEAMLEDLSDLFRHALAEQGNSSTLEEEITLAQRYLDIEQVRFGDRMRVQWQLDAAANLAQLPPLLLQPLVENAVKHGIEPSARGGKLRITTELRGGRVVLQITNTLPETGEGQAHATRGHGIALANVRERLRLLHDVDCDFSAGMQNGLYRVRIALPASHANPP
ncbi:sensor histidine kinase [Diaphorobacter aerolatus]|uniref:Histidine kinase n=1 Tax=Diaphorobacter aerolatus TaxID=1288495 RepID=A0A7H0GI36_9BURK|nr:histidine kinase [Diaphorobacter aerolatus]QNP47952.1 histidine kinase [Diaphorobacter aerolatus]